MILPDDRIPALEDIRSRHHPIRLPGGELVCESDRHAWECHAHLLLKALDAVLKLAQKLEDGFGGDPVLASMFRGAIIRELAGEENSGGH